MSDTPLPVSSRRAPLGWLACGGVVLLLLGGGAWWLLSAPAPPTLPTPPGPDVTEPAPYVVSGPLWFRDVTATSGVNFTCRTGTEADQFTILETLGGGVALFDYDGDGLLDLFVVGGGTIGPGQQLPGQPCKLYRNQGAMKFADVTQEVGLGGVAWWYTHGVAVADYDRDGRPDLLVTGYGRVALFRNDGGRFVDVTARVGLVDTSWATSAGWGDLDGDGYPDLYVCHYVDWSWTNNPTCKGQLAGVTRDVCAPQKFKPLVHALFRNDRGQRFTDETKAQNFKPDGCGLGVLLADVNADGKPDIYVGNDASNNFLFVNRSQGQGQLTLQEKGFEAGVAVNEGGRYDGSMGVDAGDFDGSGRASLWVTNFQGDLHGLYLNRGQERFDHHSRAAGLGAIGLHYVGFGTNFLDVDNDGWEDLVIVNGHVLRRPVMGSPHKQRPVLLHNVATRGRRVFREISPQGGTFFETPQLGRGLAVGDLDNDGWPDLVVSHSDAPVVILRNEAAAAKPGARWLGLKLERKDGRDAVGSTVTVELTTGRKLTRFVKGGGSYLSARDPRLLIGLDDAASIKNVAVRWSWGATQTWDTLEPGRYYKLSEGQKEASK